MWRAELLAVATVALLGRALAVPLGLRRLSRRLGLPVASGFGGGLAAGEDGRVILPSAYPALTAGLPRPLAILDLDGVARVTWLGPGDRWDSGEMLRFEAGPGRCVYLHVTLVPFLGSSEEFKTKPTQHSVATLRGVGIQPDGLILRSPSPVPDELKTKIALFTNVEARDVFNSFDTDHIYAVPETLESSLQLSEAVLVDLGVAMGPVIASIHEKRDELRQAIRAEAETQRTAIAETQATIRAEIASSDPVQRWWRPAYAWELTLECAALWGVLHSLVAARWGLVVWWPFLIFSIAYLTWRPLGYWRAVGVVTAIHLLQNAGPTIALLVLE